ncbi:hypothetical protein ACFL4U_04075, partial [Candidatus Neomarinimicrobiota bacterium]
GYVLSVLISLLMVNCDEMTDIILDGSVTADDLTVEEIEALVRNNQDQRAVFSYLEYETLLQELTNPRYIVLPINEFRTTFDSSKIIIGMRHDVDTHPFKAQEMLALENEYGIRTTYYIMHSAAYYGARRDTGYKRHACMGAIYQQIADGAGEFGVHNDLIAMMCMYDIDPLQFQIEEIEYYTSLGITIYGSAAHGSTLVINLGLSNRWIYSDFHAYGTFNYKGKTYEYGRYSLADFGLRYEAYSTQWNDYLSESGGRWSRGTSTTDIIRRLQSYEPGARVQILTHPTWWGKEQSDI